MADTHINAYEMDVQEKLEAVQAAQAEHQLAVQRLADKRRELGLDSDKQPQEQVTIEEPKDEKKGLLGKKK